ncbi:MAG: two-component regulator propeller domain-containing protein, partial [Bacteroidia bacterium]
MNYLNSLFFIFIFHVFYIYAQLPYYHLLNDENGLPSNEVYRVVEDKKGYVWIGCDAGLYRYNGFEFKLYKHPQQNSRSISYLNFDDAGNLWCANFSGQIFIVKNDSIKLVADYSSLAGKYHFCFNSYSFYWKIDKNNIEKIDINGKTLKKYPINLKNELIGNGTDLLYFKKLLWAEIPSLGFYCFDEKNERFDLLLPYDKNKSYINQRLFTLKDKLYLLRTEKNLTISSDHIYEVNTENKSIRLIIKKDNVKNTRYYSIYEDRLQNLWMASSNGAIKLKNISDWGIKAEPFFQNNKISFILYDSEGNYWFADLQNGVWIIPDMKSIFFKNKPDEPNFDITTLKTLNDSIILLGFYDGSLSFFNTRNNTFTPLDISKKITGITVKDIEVK